MRKAHKSDHNAGAKGRKGEKNEETERGARKQLAWFWRPRNKASATAPAISKGPVAVAQSAAPSGSAGAKRSKPARRETPVEDRWPAVAARRLHAAFRTPRLGRLKWDNGRVRARLRTCYNFNMDLAPEQIMAYRDAFRQLAVDQRAAMAQRYAQAWDLARRAAEILKDEYGASRVAVFCSLVHPELFHDRSVIDLAVWDVQRYFGAMRRLLDLDPGFKFELVPVNGARPVVLALIKREAVDL